MQDFILYLGHTAPKYDKANNKFFIAAFLSFIAMNFFIIRPSSITGILTLTLALIPATVLFILFYKEKILLVRQFILVDDQKIQAVFFISRFEAVDIKIFWREIASVTFNPLVIEFLLQNGSKKELKLDSLTYEQHQLFKPKLEEFLLDKNIPFKKNFFNKF
jgi:hypothetical protein